MKEKYSYEHIENIYKEYIENKTSQSDLSKKYGLKISYWFNKYGFTSSNKNTRPKIYKKILNYLDCINTEYDAYILGLFMSDGYVTNNQATIKLKKEDLKILEQIRDYICPDLEIRFKNNNAILCISSKDLVNNLIKYNCIPNKTYSIMHVPFDKIPKDLLRHFIRGYFDGDGTIFKDRKYLKTNICSICKEMLLDIQKIYIDNNIESRINVEVRCGKKCTDPQGNISKTHKDMFRLYVSKKHEIYKLYDFMYNNSNIYLERKFKKFKDNIELIK